MDLSAVGKRIRAARESKGMTQEELAAKADISPTHIGVIERGTKVPNLDTFVAIVNALEVSADVVLQDVVDKSFESQTTELSSLLAGQSATTQKKIYSALRAFLQEK